MGFREIRRQAIEAIKNGWVQHEARGGEIDEKNLLLAREVTPEQVVRLLNACKGTQHASSPHHLVQAVEVHVFKPEASLEAGQMRQRWYIKLYFLEPDVWFISVHRSGGTKGEKV